MQILKSLGLLIVDVTTPVFVVAAFLLALIAGAAFAIVRHLVIAFLRMGRG